MFPFSEPKAHNEMDGKIKLSVSHSFVSDIIVVAGLEAQREEREEVLSLAFVRV